MSHFVVLKRNDSTNENTNHFLDFPPFFSRKHAMYPPPSLRRTRQAGESIDQCENNNRSYQWRYRTLQQFSTYQCIFIPYYKWTLNTLSIQLTNKECDQIYPRSWTREFSGSDIIPCSFIQDDMIKDDNLTSLYVSQSSEGSWEGYDLPCN